MPTVDPQEPAFKAAAGTVGGVPAGVGLGSAPGHARQLMPAVELPVLQPAEASTRIDRDRGQPGGRVYDESLVDIPGLSSRPPRALASVLLGFLVGALAVGVLAFVLFQRGSGDAEEQQRSLEVRAREALSHGAIDAPPGDNVLELTRRLLETDPAHAGARSIRREAALLLRERAANARAQNDMQAARDAYLQVLRLFPEDAAATEGLRWLAQAEQVASAPPLSAGIHIDPERPTQRERVRLVGVFGPGMRLPADVVPEFTVQRAGRRLDRLPATPGDVSGTWVADYAFAQNGNHEVTLEFGVGVQRVMLREDVSVGRPDELPRGRAGRPPGGTREPVIPPAGSSRPLGPPTTLPPPSVQPVPSTMNDGIDWGVPSEPSDEPPPWTG